ncbi:MAG TPA: cytochrome-c peroxidase [Nitrospiraceae bacterium]|jgi:cytochrome c peroxidase|nr:cytochrome-c peroxidase [Nitrospiraceae bacterium]
MLLRKRNWSIFLSLVFITPAIHATPSFAASEDLIKDAKQIFGPPLPEVISSDTNPVTPQKAKLGKMLFYETRVSVDGTVSCARCHPFDLYAADGLRKSIGNQCKVNPRNAPTVLNAAGQISEHWIGNRKDVEDQATQALLGPPSFGMPSYQAAEDVLKAIKGYPPLFQAAFPENKDPVLAENFGKAIGAFERTLVTPSPFDAFLKGDKKALKDNQIQGLKTFMEVGCMTCHSGTYIGGQMYQKFGIFEPYWNYTKSQKIDDGRYEVTKQESDKYVFKVPMLRNVEMTAPYFHDGSVGHLEDAVWIMGKIQLGKDLTKEQKGSILSFLTSLTGTIPEDALKVPILPPSD